MRVGSDTVRGGPRPAPRCPQRLSKEVQNALARASNTAEETISAMKTVRSFANEEQEAEVYAQKLQQVYKLNRKEAAAYTYYVWGSGVRAPGPGRSAHRDRREGGGPLLGALAGSLQGGRPFGRDFPCARSPPAHRNAAPG